MICDKDNQTIVWSPKRFRQDCRIELSYIQYEIYKTLLKHIPVIYNPIMTLYGDNYHFTVV